MCFPLLRIERPILHIDVQILEAQIDPVVLHSDPVDENPPRADVLAESDSSPSVGDVDFRADDAAVGDDSSHQPVPARIPNSRVDRVLESFRLRVEEKDCVHVAKSVEEVLEDFLTSLKRIQHRLSSLHRSSPLHLWCLSSIVNSTVRRVDGLSFFFLPHRHKDFLAFSECCEESHSDRELVWNEKVLKLLFPLQFHFFKLFFPKAVFKKVFYLFRRFSMTILNERFQLGIHSYLVNVGDDLLQPLPRFDVIQSCIDASPSLVLLSRALLDRSSDAECVESVLPEDSSSHLVDLVL